MDIYLEQIQNLDTEFVVKISITWVCHVINKYESVFLSFQTANKWIRWSHKKEQDQKDHLDMTEKNYVILLSFCCLASNEVHVFIAPCKSIHAPLIFFSLHLSSLFTNFNLFCHFVKWTNIKYHITPGEAKRYGMHFYPALVSLILLYKTIWQDIV